MASRLDEVSGEQDAAASRRVRSAFALTIIATAGWLVTQPLLAGLNWLTLVIVVGLHLRFVLLERRHPTVSAKNIVVAVIGLGLLAVILPPYGSRDVWSYSVYGHILGVEHVSPYTHVPADFRHYLLYSRVDRLWRHTPSVYGPLFNAISAVGALFYGASPLRARLFYQLLACGALVVIVLEARRRVAPWVLALVAMAPGVLAAVNTAHLDLIVGAALLAAVLLLIDERFVAAGLVLAVAALIKIVALPAVVGVLAALVVARRWKTAWTVGGVFAAAVAGGYWFAGGAAALHPDAHGTKYVSHASIVNGIHELYENAHVGPWPWLTHSVARSTLALALAGLGMAIFMWRRRRAPDPATFALAALLIYLLTANYVLPWYAMAAMPLVLVARSRLRWSAIAIVVLLQFAYIKASRAHVPAPLLVAHIAPIVEIGLLIVVLWGRDTTPTDDLRQPDSLGHAIAGD